MEIERARATLFSNPYLHSTSPMSSFVVHFPGLTRRYLTGPFDTPSQSRRSHSPMRGSPLPPPTLAWKTCTCHDYQRPPLRLASAVAGAILVAGRHLYRVFFTMVW